MSHRLYSTRLWFSGNTGIAKLHGKIAYISECPLGYEYIDYAPEARIQLGRRKFGKLEELEKHEVQEIDTYLESMKGEMT
jgi:hypothetical protein